MTAQVSSKGTSPMDATQNEVLAEVRNHIGHLTLNRPAGLNALTLEMVRNLVEGHEATVLTARTVFPIAENANDQATCDLLTQRMQIGEKTAWMLRSLLE